MVSTKTQIKFNVQKKHEHVQHFVQGNTTSLNIVNKGYCIYSI